MHKKNTEQLVNSIDDTIKRNYAFAFINGARKAIENDYGRSYLSPTVKDNCEYVTIKTSLLFTILVIMILVVILQVLLKNMPNVIKGYYHK